nr:MAG TPA: hypothetical protein [Caudoviricetes sp.]
MEARYLSEKISISRCTLLDVYMSYRQIICVCTKRRPTHLKSELYYSCKFYGKCLYASSKHTSFIPLCFAWRPILTKISSLMPYRRYFLRVIKLAFCYFTTYTLRYFLPNLLTCEWEEKYMSMCFPLTPPPTSWAIYQCPLILTLVPNLIFLLSTEIVLPCFALRPEAVRFPQPPEHDRQPQYAVILYVPKHLTFLFFAETVVEVVKPPTVNNIAITNVIIEIFFFMIAPLVAFQFPLEVYYILIEQLQVSDTISDFCF